MGWTELHHNGTVEEFFDNNYLSENYEWIGKGSLKNHREYYRIAHNKKTDKYFIFVALISLKKNDYFNFAYKDMDESAGPTVINCPKRILQFMEKYKPCNEWAEEWRNKCWQQINRNKVLRNITDGTVITFIEPIEFMSGRKENKFIVHKGVKGRQMYFEGYHQPFHTRIAKWYERDFTIE